MKKKKMVECLEESGRKGFCNTPRLFISEWIIVAVQSERWAASKKGGRVFEAAVSTVSGKMVGGISQKKKPHKNDCVISG
jgi:hypothetical protein